MSIRVEHEIHRRRFGRNLGLALLLAGFVSVTFALTVVKVKRGNPMEGYDHVVQPGLAAKGAATP